MPVPRLRTPRCSSKVLRSQGRDTAELAAIFDMKSKDLEQIGVQVLNRLRMRPTFAAKVQTSIWPLAVRLSGCPAGSETRLSSE